MQRKIVQICAAADNEEGAVQTVTALADDGTLWQGWHHYLGKGLGTAFRWEQLPALPDNNFNLQKVR